MKITFVKKGQFLLLSSFIVLIAAGTLLLLMPGVMLQGRLSFSDALFMSCSAVCLNGLAVVPVHEFSFSGQFIMLLLVQCGGIGITTLSAMILLMLGRGLSFSDTLMISKLNDNFTLRGAESLIRTVITYTLVTEAAGMVLMFAAFIISGKSILISLWHSIYLSIGSFCNAGLSPLPDSMASTGKFVQAVSVILMILGSLGIYVIYDIVQKVHSRHHRMCLHSRIVLWMTMILLIGGALFLWILSYTDSTSVTLSLWQALFLSETSRTTGYATVDPGLLSPACLELVIVLMLIGGSPGSMAGGMKTSTVAVAFAALLCSFKGESTVMIGRRSIAWRTVLRAFTIIVIFLILFSVGGLLLNSFAPDVPTLQCYFEAASALSATGLSTGNTTAQWDTVCKLLITFFMFIGRVGPLTIILFFVGKEKADKLIYPEERVIVG